MVGVLIRLKLAVLRHSMTGARLTQLTGGLVFGLVAVAATLWLCTATYTSPEIHSEIVALVLSIWAVGWAVGPLLFTGEDTTLLPEHFRSLPVSARRLAGGLLGASFAGLPPLVSLLAFFGLVLYAVPLGAAATLVATGALVLQLIFVVVLSRVVTSAWRALTTSQLSAAVSALVTGSIAAFFSTGWVLVTSANRLAAEGLPSVAAAVVYALPSSWGVVAIDAAYNGHWQLAASALGGLVVLIFIGKFIWEKLLLRRLTTRRTHGRSAKHAASATPIARYFITPAGAVAHKELRTWWRDYTRSGYLYFALFFSIAFCLYPLAGGVAFFLPFAGALFVLAATGASANTYAADGTALWMTLTSPGAARYDIRGRQLAWLLLVGPLALLLTLGLTLASGYTWIWPWVLTLGSVLLGAGAGLFVLVSVIRLLPMTDPQKRGNDAYEHGLDWLQFMMTLLLSALLAVPSIGLLWWAVQLHSSLLAWAAVLVGLVSGVFYAWWLGRLAYRRLELHGPELLFLMRTGKLSEVAAKPEAKNPLETMPPLQKFLFYACAFVAPIALFPQGLVPLLFKLTGQEETRVWFLPLYLPGVWQWPAIIGMITLGTLTFGCMAYLYRRQGRKG